MTTQERGRDVLPIPDRAYTGLIKYDARDPESVFPKMELLRPPEGAPNVVVVLLDDVGFGASSAFGGPCQTPAAIEEFVGYYNNQRYHESLDNMTPASILLWKRKGGSIRTRENQARNHVLTLPTELSSGR